jgi:hypothetical protein
MLRHDHVTGNCKERTQTSALQRIFKKLRGRDCRQVRATTITTEGEEVILPRPPIPDALAFHTLQGYSKCEFVGSEMAVLHPRSPKARDRGHPRRGLTSSSGPGSPAS